MTSRENDLDRIKKTMGTSVRLSSPTFVLAEGDSLEMLRQMPSHSVSLILTDPPYHSTKKQNIYGDTHFEEDQHYLEWMAKYAKEWHRVLRPNGSIFCFCAVEMAARLEVLFAKEFNILAHIVWTKPNEPGFDGWKQKMKKESLRQWYAHTERIIFAEPACEGNLFRSSFANFLREMRKKSGLTMNQLTAIIGAHGKVNHGGAVSNWEAGRNTPSRDQYKKMCDALIATGKIDSMPPYEDAIRPFIIDGTKEFTDVWNFQNVRPYKGKHPAEKPADLLEHAISVTSYPGDIVLDCFGGSGSTAFAALRLGRLTVSMEIDPTLVNKIAMGLEAIGSNQGISSLKVMNKKSLIRKPERIPQLGLFSGVK